MKSDITQGVRLTLAGWHTYYSGNLCDLLHRRLWICTGVWWPPSDTWKDSLQFMFLAAWTSNQLDQWDLGAAFLSLGYMLIDQLTPARFFFQTVHILCVWFAYCFCFVFSFILKDHTLPTARTFLVWIFAEPFLCGVCLFSPCLCGFSLGTLTSSHSLKAKHIKLIGDSQLIVGVSVSMFVYLRCFCVAM